MDSCKRLLETTWVQSDAEFRFDQRHQPARSDMTVPGSVIVHEAQDFRRDLVRPARPAGRWDQPLQPTHVEGTSHAEAGRARHPEPLRRLGEGGLSDPHQPDHLVAHLQQIAGVEEVVVGKHRIVDVFRGPVEGSGLLQPLSLFGLRVFHDVIVEVVRFIY